ncbi:hypothetical protein [Methylobacterium soli]|uniref:Uncharacterized protein n=1 Tax=Methylobacterium soli TaxID=553447 RepID=A0A6L3SYC2_9HYPH|nr:hypothetical protein [Methylobacterium soli]KAB1077141.1 hypothetical protein F6X53_19845 [Methylobacterium soli]
MSNSHCPGSGPYARLRDRIALIIALEEVAISALSDGLAAIRKQCPDEDVSDLEHAVRAHRIGILKQRAVLGGLGIEV